MAPTWLQGGTIRVGCAKPLARLFKLSAVNPTSAVITAAQLTALAAAFVIRAKPP